jgi:hypothetical protein
MSTLVAETNREKEKRPLTAEGLRRRRARRRPDAIALGDSANGNGLPSGGTCTFAAADCAAD